MKINVTSYWRRAGALMSVLPLLACSSSLPKAGAALASRDVSALPSATLHTAVRPGIPPALWWRSLGDPQLAALVELAWTNNHDVLAAVARLDGARQMTQAAQAERWPAIDLTLSGSRGASDAVKPRRWQAALAWELDLFGRVRHSIAAADGHAQERAALADDVRRVILSDVIAAYLELRAAQARGASLREQLANQAGILDLVRQRESWGKVAAAERIGFEAQFRVSTSRLSTFTAQERAARNRLATLTGQRLDSPQLGLLDPPLTLEVPQGLVTDEPARLLLRRPDVKAAERALAVAAAREGIAHADLFPRVSIAALIGGTGAASWSASAALFAPLFDAGGRRALLGAARADVRVADAAFEKTVLVALEETDTAISNWLQQRTRHAELVVALELAREGARLTRLRYEQGGESMLGVLESERIALEAAEQMLIAKHNLILATAQSYVAMAGGVDADDAGSETRHGK